MPDLQEGNMSDVHCDNRKKDWEDLDMSHEELNTLTECMKCDDFRKLLLEYVDEVNDPENRRQYEAELKQLERERGIDLQFVKPEPGYVIKTSLDGRLKCFLNIGQSECVGRPTSQPATATAIDTHDADNVAGQHTQGLNWSIPYILAPPRDDLDKSHNRCRVFDVVFHPDTLYLAERNARIRDLVNQTAMDGVESNFKVKLDRKNIKFPKLSFKGVSQPTVIRKPCPESAEKLDIDEEIYQKLMSSYDASRKKQVIPNEEKSSRPPPTSIYYKNKETNNEDVHSEYTTPKFVIKHQSSIELDEFIESKDAKMNSTIPKNLVIIVNLPLLKSAGDATLDVQENHLSLKSERPAKYNLELSLPYRVDPNDGDAKFDSKLRRLTVTLPVIHNPSFVGETKEDSGVESDHGSPLPKLEVLNNRLKVDETEDFQKMESDLLSLNLSDTNNVQCDLDYTDLQTRQPEKTTMYFMNPNIQYFLPPFTCNLYDNVLAITIHAKNVDSDSIQHKTLDDNAGLHVLLTSLGAGFYPMYYSLCLKIEKDRIIPDTVTVEPWDNNVVLSFKVKNAETLLHCFIGMNENCLESKELSVGASIKNKLQALTENLELEIDKNVEVTRSKKEVTVNVRAQGEETDHEDGLESESHSQDEQQKRSFVKSRSVSESSGNEFSSSIGSDCTSVQYKSILKFHRLSRSVSESVINGDSVPLSSVTSNNLIHELNSECEGSSLKKTVRFNDVVSRQLYRSNSSILGQRKKNQRKLRNKKRAQERRMSESENSETEEREKYKVHARSEVDTLNKVRPILHQNKCSEKTANINIEQGSSRSVNKRKQKRNVESMIEVSANYDKTFKTEKDSNGEESSESKIELLFDLDM